VAVLTAGRSCDSTGARLASRPMARTVPATALTRCSSPQLVSCSRMSFTSFEGWQHGKSGSAIPCIALQAPA